MKTLKSQTKLAAPRSQRGFWSRLFSPSGGSRGSQKDTELEMDNVLEGISTIAQSAQQIRNSISALQYQAASLGGYPAITSAIGNLSPNDWNRTLQAVQSLQTAIASAPPDTNLFQLRDLTYGVSNNMGNVYNQIERMQRNMFNLRQRDPVKGRTYGPSAAEEFGHLEMSLEKLIRNPLDERALFYSQKLHGRLEDALNMRSTSMGPEFQDWINTHQGPSPFEPETPQETTETTESTQIRPEGGNSIEETAQQLAQALGPGFTSELIRALEGMAQSDYGTKPEADNLTHIIQELRTPMSGSPDAGVGTSEVEDKGRMEPADQPMGGFSSPREIQEVRVPRTRYDNETMLDIDDWNNVDMEEETIGRSHIDTLIKIADIVDSISPEIASMLDEYIAKHTKEDESSFEFPENALILKEDTKSTLKI